MEPIWCKDFLWQTDLYKTLTHGMVIGRLFSYIPTTLWNFEVGGLWLYFLRFYLFTFRERGRKGEKHQCVVACHTHPYWGPGLQPRHVPWLGIEPGTLSFEGQQSIQWATPPKYMMVYIDCDPQHLIGTQQMWWKNGPWLLSNHWILSWYYLDHC